MDIVKKIIIFIIPVEKCKIIFYNEKSSKA